MVKTADKMTPMMQQWQACKGKAGEAIVLFRLGDFYEAFYEDAQLMSRELEVTLTQRQGIPMAGVPAHAVEGYLDRLVEKGHLVAIADQVEDAREAKGLVRREIVRTVSPATHVESKTMNESPNSFFASITQLNQVLGLALVDVSTGELYVSEVLRDTDLLDELSKRRPKELLVSKRFAKDHGPFLESLKLQFPFQKRVKEDWAFDHRTACEALTKHFQVQSLDGFGLGGMTASINSAGALMGHLEQVMGAHTGHIRRVSKVQLEHFMSIDRSSLRHLEIMQPLHREGGHTLLGLLDATQTPMGARRFRTWISHPLIDVKAIKARQEGVAELIEERALYTHLGQVRDLERLVMRIEAGFAGPRDLVGLKNSLAQVPHIVERVGSFHAPMFAKLLPALGDPRSIVQLIETAIVEAPPVKLQEGGIFKRGFCSELDELYDLREGGKTWLVDYQNRLREELSIKTLKVNFNRAFGYYIEVSRGQADKMPERFMKRQTLVNNERFISSELKEYETKVLSAEEEIGKIEYRLFTQVRSEVAGHADHIRKCAEAISLIDCLAGLATVAKRRGYVCPEVDESDRLEIVGGRHPVVEVMQIEHSFVPNDTHLDENSRLMLITGPNMAGKSTYIRQVAMLTIMAQIGSFVPAEKMHLGVIDKLFSRIGASDDLSRGQSTFMVEMSETANILHNATDRSLVILDEIGRGTSTYDGVSIARAIAEHLLTVVRPKTLFATHYFELTDLHKQCAGAVNFQVAVDEGEEGITFLHKILEGSADKSYGIHVAKLAGLPRSALERAGQVLSSLEQKPAAKTPVKAPKEGQMTLFPTGDEQRAARVLATLKKSKAEEMTPIEALTLLDSLIKELT